MKKVVCLLLIIAFTMSFSMLAFADGENVDEKFLDRFPIVNSEEYLEILKNEELYYKNMKDFVINDDSIVIQLYACLLFFFEYDFDYDTMQQRALELAKEQKYHLFAVINDDDIEFVSYNYDHFENFSLYMYESMREEYTYLNDIMNMTVNTEICGVKCQVERIACYDLEAAHYGTLIYIDTDQGVFVRYYDDFAAPAIEMTEEEYKIRAEQYRNYLYSLPDGIGGGTSFAEFIENPIIVDPPAKDDNENESENLTTGTVNNPKDEKDSGVSALWWIIPTTAAVVLLGGAVAFIALRKKKT